MIDPVLVKGRVQLPEGIETARWMGLLFESTEEDVDAREWTRVNRDTLTFETSRLIPGTYKVTFYGGFEGGFKPVELVVPRSGATNVVLALERE